MNALVIAADVRVTRRTRQHFVMRDGETLAFSTPSIVEAIDYCVEQGQTAIWISDGRSSVQITVHNIAVGSDIARPAKAEQG